MTRTKLIAGALGALLLLAGGGVGFMAWRLKPAIAESAPLPGIALTDLAGKPYDLAQHKGKVLVLDFWSST